MTPDFVASNDAYHPFTQSYSGGLIDRQPSSLPHDLTINPSFLHGNQQSLLQYNSSPTSLYIPEGSHYQDPSPAPSTSTGVWMGYPGDEASASAPSLISPVVGNKVRALV